MLVAETGDIWSGHVDCYYAAHPVGSQSISLEGWPFTVSDRKRFTKDQLWILFNSFELRIYPSLAEYDRLVSATGLARKQVTAWFRNHRASLRRRLRSYAV